VQVSQSRVDFEVFDISQLLFDRSLAQVTELPPGAMDQEERFGRYRLSKASVDHHLPNFHAGCDLHFDYDLDHRIFVLASQQNYVIFRGEAVQQEAMVQDGATLELQPVYQSIVDHKVEAAFIKNMRLFLLDEQYSMNVLNLILQKYASLMQVERRCWFQDISQGRAAVH
jgi:hypothetical protein